MITNKTEQIIQKALAEDNVKQDKTTRLVVPGGKRGRVVIIAKEKGILCGVDLVKLVLNRIDKQLKIKFFAKDGVRLRKNQKVAVVSGSLQSILKAERTALNFLSLLSGIATTTRLFADKVKKTKVIIKDTRKTTPGLRRLEKYAVFVGGGKNHRQTLADGIIIKDNHLKAAAIINKKNKINHQCLKAAIENLRKRTNLPIEIEVETFAEFFEIVKYRPEVVMLDNFSKRDLIRAVSYRNKYFPKVELEASGRISLRNIATVALTGVDSISIGSITHSPKALDFSLEII